jgi:hypothetical protein
VYDYDCRVGMVDDETADWFVSTEKRPITFERRIPEIMMPCMKEAGLEDMKPDLVVFSSLFWDESFIWRVSLVFGGRSCDEDISRSRRGWLVRG